MLTVGTSEQEDRLAKMAEVAHEMASDVEPIAFKGLFRFAIDSAVKTHGLGSWTEMSARGQAEKTRFFEDVLTAAKGRMLSFGLSVAQEAALEKILREWIFLDTSKNDRA